MHKKYHKLHRHKDINHKHSSKSRTNHKQKKERAASQSVLEPIQEVSKEKVKIDKNACGDFIQPLLIPQFEDDRKNKSKHRRDKGRTSNKGEKLNKDEHNIFAKNYIDKLREPTKQNSVRHQSLEKNQDSLISKTKNLFRKEKSFNDAVKEKACNEEEIKRHYKKERKHQHRRRKYDENHSEEVEDKKEKRTRSEKTSKKSDKDSKEEKRHKKEKKREKSAKRKAKTDEKSSSGGKNIYSRVQEVIYCHLDQVPYKLKNDKSAAEIKDLYQRINKHKRRHDSEDDAKKERSNSHGDEKKESNLEKSKNHQGHHSIKREKKDIEKEHKKERSKSRSRKEQKETIPKEDRKSDRHSRDQSKDRNKGRYCYHDLEGRYEHSQRESKLFSNKSHKNNSLSNINLGPYEKYFAFEKKESKEHHKKHSQKEDNHKKSRDKKRQREEESISHLEDCHEHGKRKREKNVINIQPIYEHKLKADEEKIHKIVEGDLKTYFFKIQHMIDQKLDTLLQINKNKDKHENQNHSNKEDESRQQTKSKGKEREKDEKDEKSKKEKKKNNNIGETETNITKEEIVQEVLKRIRKETERAMLKETEIKHDEKNKRIKAETDKDVNDSREKCKKIQETGKIRELKEALHSFPKKVSDLPSDLRSSEKRKHSEDIINKSYSVSQDAVPTQKSSSKRQHRQHIKNVEQLSTELKHSSPTNRSSSRQHYTQERSSQKKHYKQEENLENKVLPKDSLVYMRNRNKPPQELLIPIADVNNLSWKGHVKCPGNHRRSHTRISASRSLKRHYTSASSCRAYSDQTQLGASYDHQGKSSLERRTRSPREIHAARKNQAHYPESGYAKTSLNSEEVHYLKKYMVVPQSEDYIMPPRELRVSNERTSELLNNEFYQRHMHSPNRKHTRHNREVLNADSYLENIILPPEEFRTQTLNDNCNQLHVERHSQSPRKRHPKQEFLVQGIEPAILEWSRKKSGERIRVRNLECKTVSIIGIPPQVRVPLTNQTQTSSKSHKISAEGDLVEKRKHSKRFKLYYKYSVVHNGKEDKDSGTSDVKSIVSDSFRVVSDPSEEDRPAVYYSKDARKDRKFCMSSEVTQILNIVPKKWNRVATPRESHLNNIIEEPSNLTDSTKNNDYFIPIRGANECYFRALTSSHSEYCFKINKKPANSNISIQSKDTWGGMYRYYEDGRCRFCKHEIRSKSDFNLVPNDNRIQILRSKSDVFSGSTSGKKIIKSIFLEDTHPFAKSKKRSMMPKNLPVFKNGLKNNAYSVSTCKECQTSNIKINEEYMTVKEEESTLVFNNKQKQFKEIYQTIDNLEENIHRSQKTPPKKLDVAVSSKFLSLDEISDKKPQFNEIYRTIEKLEDTVRSRPRKKLVDAAIGSPIKTDRTQRSARSEPRKNTHEMAVGYSKENVVKREKSLCAESESKHNKLKSTGVSPIRILANVKVPKSSPTRKTTTPMSPVIRPYVIRPAVQKQTKAAQDGSPIRKPVAKPIETRKEPPQRTNIAPKVLVVKEPHLKSPQRKEVNSNDQKNQKCIDYPQPISAGIRVIRSTDKSQRENSSKDQPKDKRLIDENTNITTDKNFKQDIKEGLKDRCFIVNRLENEKFVKTGPKKKTSIPSKPAPKPVSKDKADIVKQSPCSNSKEDLRKSCLHPYNPKDLNDSSSSSSSVDSEKSPPVTSSKPVTINAAIIECRPPSKKKYFEIERSISSSIADELGQKIRKSRSLVEIPTQKTATNRSKSEILNVENALVICSTRNTNGESANMEKYTNMPRLRCHSVKSNTPSFDQFIGNKFTSRLFLTKDYKSAEISAYQRRKLYDQSIRQKMKKKFRVAKMEVGPQIFEVRFLSTVNQENCQSRERDVKINQYFDRPLYSLNLGKVKTESSVFKRGLYNESLVNDNNNVSKVKQEGNTYIEEILRGKETEVIDNEKQENSELKPIDDLLIRESAFSTPPENFDPPNKDVVVQDLPTKVKGKSVTELYFKDEKHHQDKLLSFCNKLLEVNSCLGFQEEFKAAQCTCTKFSEDCQSCKNFVNLMDMLCCSLATYCDSKNNLIDFKLESKFNSKSSDNQSKHKTEITENPNILKDESDNLHVHLKNFEMSEAFNNVQEVCSKCESNTFGNSKVSVENSDKIFKNYVDFESLSTTNRSDDVPVLLQPLSCPILPTLTPSFEFLYEETSSLDEGIHREVLLANLTRPFDQTFNFSLSQYNVETPFFRRNGYFSATGSSESGYLSIESKTLKGTSLVSFFKKPNIAALFKPLQSIKKESELSKIYEHRGQGDFKNSSLYKEMTKSCQLYARKVRESCETKEKEHVNEYQEFSLALLLGKNSSVVLESKAMSYQSGTQIVLEATNDDEVNTEEISDSKIKTEEINKDDDKDGLSKNSGAFMENGCKLVLSNECLKIDSITYLGAEIFSEEAPNLDRKISKESQMELENDENKTDKDASLKDGDSSFTLDFSLDSNNPFIPSKDSIAQTFFVSLTKIHEKETELCNELFKDDAFLKNVLLPAVKERRKKEKKNRKSRLSRFFKRKPQDNQTNSVENGCDHKIISQKETSAKLQNLAFNAKKCFTMLADAVKVNGNIDDEIKICGLLKLLERIENGDFYMIQNNDDSTFEEDVRSQVKEAFINIYEICEKQAKKSKRRIGNQEINLIKGFVSKYRIGLLSKTDIVACCIGQGVIQTEAQLKAAVTYLMHSQSDKVDIKKFKEFCNFNKTSEE